MQEVTGVSYETSEQHKDSSQARIERDDDDITELLGFLQDRNPFGDDPTLRNIASGVTADSAVNVEVGDKILEAMKAKNVMELPKLPSKSKEK